MMVRRLSAVDAQTYWMSAKIPNDQFLLYGFAGVASDQERTLDAIRQRAQSCPELRLRVEDRNAFTYPAWVSGQVEPGQFVVHEPADNGWAGCLAAVAGLAEHQLDPHRMAWRLHVFAPVDGVPGAGVGTVAVLQAAHVLGDGIRSSVLAAWLFGRAEEVPPVPAPPPFRGVTLPWLAFRAARAHRQFVHDTDAGLVPAQADSRPTLRSNARPDGVRSIRTVIRWRKPVSVGRTTTSAMRASGCTPNWISTRGWPASSRTWPSGAAGPHIRRCSRPAGRSRQCLRRYYAGG
jgi:Wax ester synthase/diacylglycerol acyltransferase catalytic domain